MSQEIPYNESLLLLKIAERDEGAMEMVFKRYYPRLSYFAARLTGDLSAGEDIAQETLISLWYNSGQTDVGPVNNLEAYLFRIARNKSYNFTRHLKMRSGKEDLVRDAFVLSEEFIEAQLIQEDIFNKIYLEIQQLPSLQATLLKLIYVEGLDTIEIAERLQITPNNVRNLKARALAKVRATILKNKLLGLLLFFFEYFL